MTNILSQEEVDALLRGISGGEIATRAEEHQESGIAIPYDLTSHDKVSLRRMPNLEMANEKFARLFRATLSSLLRKVISVSAVSTDIIKYGEFLKTLPVPTSLHLFRMEPMRGSAIFIMESRLIYMLVDLIFGGTGSGSFKIEGREFTSIENNLIKKIVLYALSDLEKSWKSLIDLKVSYQRAEVNPQFLQIVPATDVLVVLNFEIDLENTSGVVSICVPYSMLDPIREKLSAGFQNEQLDADKGWINKFRSGLLKSYVDIFVELGRTQVFAKDIVNLKKGDVIQLEHYATDPLDIYVEGIKKFKGYPGNYKGSQAVQISGIVTGKEEG